MAELIQNLNASTDEHPLIKAGMAHLNLAKIHPFSDGNGRMARCLHTLVLARVGILDPTFSSIEEYLGRNTPEYYRVLEAVGPRVWEPSSPCDPWISFVLIAHYRQADTLLRRIRETRIVWDELEELIKQRGLAERSIFALSDAAFGYRVRNATYRAAAEVEIGIASRDLKLIAAAGLLEPIGDGRGRYYRASNVIREIRERAREKQRRPEPDALHQLNLFKS
jgi:Fic family protein